MHLPKELTTVTHTSKTLALLMVVLLPFIGFFLGQQSVSPLFLSDTVRTVRTNKALPSSSPKPAPQEINGMKNYFVSDILSKYPLLTPQIDPSTITNLTSFPIGWRRNDPSSGEQAWLTDTQTNGIYRRYFFTSKYQKMIDDVACPYSAVQESGQLVYNSKEYLLVTEDCTSTDGSVQKALSLYSLDLGKKISFTKNNIPVEQEFQPNWFNGEIFAKIFAVYGNILVVYFGGDLSSPDMINAMGFIDIPTGKLKDFKFFHSSNVPEI